MERPLPADSPRRRGLIIAGWALFLVLSASQFFLVRREPHHGDLFTYLHAAEHLARSPNQSVYAANPEFVYPPFLAILTRPLTRIRPPLLGAGWDIAKFACIALSLGLAHRILARRLRPLAAILLTIGIGLASARSAWHDGLRGNVNSFLIAGIMIGWQAFRCGRPRHAGLAWGLVAAIKPSSALLLATIAGAPRKNVALCWSYAAICFVAANGILPACLLGVPNTLRQWADYPRGLSDLPEVYAKFGNQSLGLSLARAACRLETGAMPEPPPNITRWRWIGNAAVLFWTILLLRRVNRHPIPRAADIAVALGCILSTLISPLVWYSHYLLLIPAYLVVLIRIAGAASRWKRGFAISALTFAAITISLKAAILGAVAWAPLMMLLALTITARPGREADAPEASARPSQ